MKTIPGIVGAVALVAVTALVTWQVAAKWCPGKRVALQKSFYGLVVQKAEFKKSRDAFEGALRNVNEADAASCQSADLSTCGTSYCFWYIDPNDPKNDKSYVHGPRVNVDNGKIEVVAANCTKPAPNMSVLSHKIYSIRPCDVANVAATIN